LLARGTVLVAALARVAQRRGGARGVRAGTAAVLVAGAVVAS
jgi:hypothetical protein